MTQTANRKYRIGLCIRIDKPTESFFTNGIKQNAISLYRLFRKCPNVERAVFVNLGSQKDLSLSPWRAFQPDILEYAEALKLVDVFIMLTVTLPASLLKPIKQRGLRVVAHIMGNEYQQLNENILFDGTCATPDFSRRMAHDGLWISPHLHPSNKDLFEVLTDAPARIGPYIWSPEYVTTQVETLKLKDGISGFYKPSVKEKQVSVFEPNLAVVKTCITPLIALEKFYRRRPDLLRHASIFGADRVMNRKPLVEFASGLEIQRNKKVFFEGRYPIAWSLFTHTDVVLSHQQDVDLNYLYFDAAWHGFPLVHNSETLRDLGFHYPRNDAEAASERLIEACEAAKDDAWVADYTVRSRKLISRFLWDQPENIAGYARLLDEVMSR